MNRAKENSYNFGHSRLTGMGTTLEAVDPVREIVMSANKSPIGVWFAPAVIQPNHFVNKSLSSWSYNIAVGCSHGCRFCYVPKAATIKQSHSLAGYGVADPDAEWGEYVLLRPWEESKFLSSLHSAERTPGEKLNADGNRAVMFCTTTDPYQVIHHPNSDMRRLLINHSRFLVRRALELIRDHSSLNVRILTRSPMARLDFDLYRSFGSRLLFGMSVPTLRNDLSKIYEPRAPAPTQRVSTLRAAKEAGLHVYVAMAPTYPECDLDDLRATLKVIKELKPITIFHEPINLRADNAARIARAAAEIGVRSQTDLFADREKWRAYAIESLFCVWDLSLELGLRRKMHLWPDKALGTKQAIMSMPNPKQYAAWLRTRWDRISEWPNTAATNQDLKQNSLGTMT
jgi:DNA repair photolyase